MSTRLNRSPSGPLSKILVAPTTIPSAGVASAGVVASPASRGTHNTAVLSVDVFTVGSPLLNDGEYPEFKDPDYLNRVTIDPDSNDPVWPNGASLCKNAIYKQLELKVLLNNFHIDIDKI